MYLNYFPSISFLVNIFLIIFFGYCKFMVIEINLRLILKCKLVLKIQVGVLYCIVLYCIEIMNI